MIDGGAIKIFYCVTVRPLVLDRSHFYNADINSLIRFFLSFVKIAKLRDTRESTENEENK